MELGYPLLRLLTINGSRSGSEAEGQAIALRTSGEKVGECHSSGDEWHCHICGHINPTPHIDKAVDKGEVMTNCGKCDTPFLLKKV